MPLIWVFKLPLVFAPAGANSARFFKNNENREASASRLFFELSASLLEGGGCGVSRRRRESGSFIAAVDSMG